MRNGFHTSNMEVHMRKSEDWEFTIPTASIVRALGGKAHFDASEHTLVITLDDISTD